MIHSNEPLTWDAVKPFCFMEMEDLASINGEIFFTVVDGVDGEHRLINWHLGDEVLPESLWPKTIGDLETMCFTSGFSLETLYNEELV